MLFYNLKLHYFKNKIINRLNLKLILCIFYINLFIVVDMRWGVRDEATDDHMTTELCMKEIENCQRLSMGPNFVAFLGQKYGYRPLPSTIDGDEFNKLVRILEEMEITEVQLLNKWYNVDTNSVPSVFVLQPISSILKHFNNKENVELQLKDQCTWWETEEKLEKLLRISANHAFSKGLIQEKAKHNYMMSVTEREIDKGILSVQNTRNHCLVYIRQINKINITNINLVSKYIDITKIGDIDNEAQNLLKNLIDQRIVDKIQQSNLAKFKVDWDEDKGLNKNAHSDYLRQFSSHFYHHITKLIGRAMRKEDQSLLGKIITEILHNSHACNKAIEVFLGRDKELDLIEKYIKSEINVPLVLYGYSGCGKTTLLAKAASMIDQWCTKTKRLLILRFIGTTPESSAVIPMLSSICQQIAYNFLLPLDNFPDDLIGLIFSFKQLLLFATEEQPLFIFIDSLDQLIGPEEGIKLSWLTQELPTNVKMITSVASDSEFKELHFIQKIIEDKEQYIEVKPVDNNLGIDVIKCWLNLSKRNLTINQWKLVHQALDECTLPLFIKLVFAEVVRWKSYSKPSETLLSTNIRDSIMHLFNRIEVQHGKVLVSHALAYITASKNGLSESELEDLLSLDDIVLNDVFQYHLPPVRRIPPLLWTRIRNDLPNYLTERNAQGVNALNWYHRQFRETSLLRYIKTHGSKIYFHSMIADYFIGVWGGGKVKPFKYSESQKKRFSLTNDHGESDRKVPLQPLAYFGLNAQIVRYNLRKLGELPYHLTQSKRYDDLLKIVLFDYDWLHAKLYSYPLQAVLSDFENAILKLQSEESSELMIIKEISLLANTLRLAGAVLIQYPDMLAPQILARLLPLRDHYKNIDHLLKFCDIKGANHCSLLPINHCLHTPGGPLMYSLEGHPFAVFDFALTSDLRYVLSISNKFLMYDLTSGEISRDIDPDIRGIMFELVLTCDDKYAVTYTNYNEIYILNILTGQVNLLSVEDTGFTHNICGLSLSLDGLHLVLWTCQQWIVLDTKQKGFIISQDSLDRLSENVDAVKINYINYVNQEELHLIVQTKDNNYVFKTLFKTKEFKSVLLTTGVVLYYDKSLLFIGDNTNKVHFLRRRKNKWGCSKPLDCKGISDDNQLLSLIISPDKTFLIGVYLKGFNLWKLNTNPFENKIYLQLPSGVRNISMKPLRYDVFITFTKLNYAITGIRKNLYIWSIVDGTLLKTLDAHYGRIIKIKPLIIDNLNAIITSSFDKTIKVWNVENVFEQIYSIDRLELPIDSISFSSHKRVAMTVTRNCLAIWTVDTGRIWTVLVDSTIGAIITHALISDSGQYIVSIESGNFLIWDLEKAIVIHRCPQNQVLNLTLADNDRKVLIAEQLVDNVQHNILLKVKSIPDGQLLYHICYYSFNITQQKMPIVTRDNQYIVTSYSTRTNEYLGVYKLCHGDFVHKMEYERIKFSELVSHPYKGKDKVVALISADLSYIVDVYTQRILVKVKRWNGHCTSDGKYGLFTPIRGGLELIQLDYGSTVKVLLPRTNEGVFNVTAAFTSTDEYVYYYHSGRKTIKLIRLVDGKIIANYKFSAEVKVIKSTPDGNYLVVGGCDGSFTVLIIADPHNRDYYKRLNQLESRRSCYENFRDPMVLWKMAAKLAIAINKKDNHEESNTSKTCNIT